MPTFYPQTGSTRTAIFTVASVQYFFDVLADKVPRDQDSEIAQHPIPPGAAGSPWVTYLDLGGTRPQDNTFGVLCLNDAEFALLESVVNQQGVLVTVLDGQWNAVLKKTHRGKRWGSGEVEADVQFIMWH
jgi:hypothetical protein